MLDYLKVENFAVVEKAEMEFSEGLNVLTGETGAGKSILIGAVNHFLKKKIPENALRGNGKRLVVEAFFTQGDDEFVLRREAGDKKSQCYINGQLTPFFQLKEKAEGLFNIYGQNEHTFLLNPVNHRIYLDEYCRSQPLLEKLEQSYKELKKTAGELQELKDSRDKAAERLEFINFQVTEIDDLGMAPGDEEILEQRLKILTSADEILQAAHGLIRCFYQEDDSIYNTISQNQKKLDYLQDIYPDVVPLSQEVERFQNLLPELSATLSNIVGKVDYNDRELQENETRMSKLNSLKSKYKLNFEKLLEKRDRLKEERETLRDVDFSIKEKEKEVQVLLDEYKKRNLKLREKRKKKAEQLSSAVCKELAKLEMKKARFLVQVRELEPGLSNITDKGTDTLEFYFSSNPGQEPGRIRDIASGGELSRLMLVLKSILNTDEHSTYIFDEVDAGIGGKTAEFVGDKLQRIADRNQVICISHLPQIASFADTHFLIKKDFRKDQTFTSVTQLSEAERPNEIGRLMVGSDVTGDVIKAARNLLDKNRKPDDA